MKETFKVFEQTDYPNLQKVKSTTLIVFDTNTLLHIYRYSKETKKMLLDSLNNLKDNIWIPFQVGLEFNFNRKEVLWGYKKKLENTQNTIQKLVKYNMNESLKDAINELDIRSLDYTDQRVKTIENIDSIIKKSEKKLQKKIEKVLNDELFSLLDLDDDSLNEIQNVFNQRIGPEPDQEWLNEEIKNAEDRYKKKIPPGFDDIKKEGHTNFGKLHIPKKYGDYFFWKQIIDYLKEHDKYTDLVIVSDDLKTDWRYRTSGKTIGPRIELIKELQDETGCNLYTYSTNEFLKRHNDVSKNFIEEKRRSSRSRQYHEKTVHSYFLKNILEKEDDTNNKIPLLSKKEQENIAKYSFLRDLIVDVYNSEFLPKYLNNLKSNELNNLDKESLKSLFLGQVITRLASSRDFNRPSNDEIYLIKKRINLLLDNLGEY